MSSLKINFNSPIPHSQRQQLIKSMRDLGFSYERIYQSGVYSLHRFYGRLPTVSGSSDVDVIFTDKKSREDFEQIKDLNYVEIFVLIERE